MTIFTFFTSILVSSILIGCSVASPIRAPIKTTADFVDLTKDATRETIVIPGKVYRLGETGICGTVEKEYIKVTYIIPGSVADGKILVGDILRGMQYRSMHARGGNVPATARLRLYRIGRDWDWHFYVTVERSSLRNGKGNTIIYDLHMPPAPGNICHYGPTGFFAERHSDHLVVDVVDSGSPSDGRLMKGDVILAINDNPITVNAYQQFTKAVDKAESVDGKGELRLRVRRTGELPEGTTATSLRKKGKKKTKEKNTSTNPQESKELEVALQLKVLGSYSKTAPSNCTKTDALITQTADYLLKSKNFGKLKWGLLGLLATGEEKYIKAAANLIRASAQPPEDPDAFLKPRMYVSWHWGYQNLLLTEYYLLSGDRYVLPKIRQLSRTLAAGQDQAGLWGHQMAKPTTGRAHGYGVMNQPSLAIFISLILAEKCGVKNHSVLTAIKRSHDHYNKWVEQGALPYGNHGPGATHFTNNGTSGSLAVAFALLGNESGARFYGGMSAAATDEILLGHGGPMWNILWSGLGSNILGPKMATAYNNKTHWLRTTTRTWDGRYVSIRGWGTDPKSGDWSTGSHLLNLCAGRRKIHITGKGMAASLWVKANKAVEITNVAKLDTSSDKDLLESLGNYFPPVRLRAARALAMKDAQVEGEVMKLLIKGSRNQKIGAIHAIQTLKLETVVDPLLAISLNEKEDLWVRRLAIGTLGNMKEAKPHAPKLLEMLVREKEYDQPYGELDLSLGTALVKLYQPDPYATQLNKDLFYRGITKLLKHKHGRGRGAGMQMLKNIPKEDLGRMIDTMVYIIEDKDKGYTFYPDAGRQEALEILYNHDVKESMEYTINTAKQGRGYQQRARMRLLKTFGAEAKYLIPRIKEILGKNAEPILKQIEESTTTKTMISLKEIKRNKE